MKQFLFLFILLPFLSASQNVEILVSDSETNEALPFANIYFKKSGLGASTNREGYAFFKQSELIEGDSAVVSYIGYDKQIWVCSKEYIEQTISIKLTPSSHLLSEVVVTYVKPPKPEKIIRRAIRNVSQNYSNQDVIYTSLYRETVNENENFIQLNEAIVKTYYTGYPKKKLDRKIWYDWYHDESYAFELEGDRLFYPLLKDFNTVEDHQVIVASRHSENLSKHGIETTLVGDPLLLFAFDKIKYQYDFFNLSILNKYQFKHIGDEFLNGETCYVISFYPKSTNRKFIIDMGRKNKSPIYIGRMYISKESYALVKFQYKLAVDRDFGFFAKKMPLDYQVEMNYKKQNGIYSIDNIKFSETKKVGTKDNGEAILHKAGSELYVLDIQTKNIVPFADSTIFKSTRFSSIRHYKHNYNPEYWDEINLNDSIQLSQELISDLEIKQPLFEQFNSFKQEQKKDLSPPYIFKQYFSSDDHNNVVVDSLHWMASPIYENKLKEYVVAENKYAKNELVEDKKYQKKLFEQLNTFYFKQTDSTEQVKPDAYFFEEDSLSNDVFYYQRDSINKVVVLNLTLFKEGRKDIFIKKMFLINQKIEFSYNTRNLESSEILHQSCLLVKISKLILPLISTRFNGAQIRHFFTQKQTTLGAPEHFIIEILEAKLIL